MMLTIEFKILIMIRIKITIEPKYILSSMCDLSIIIVDKSYIRSS